MYRRKTKVIIVMIIMIVFMAVGYALLSSSLNINGSTAVTSNWQVEFSDIRTISQKGGATNKVIPTITATTANFEVDLVQPGDEITYEIDITNYGDIEAEVKGATYTGTGRDAIYVRFDGIRKGTRIASCEGQSTCPKVTVTVKVGYDASITSDPEEKTKDISITLDIGQYVSSNPTPDGELLPELGYPTLVQQILNDNKVQQDTNIDFSQISSNTNGKGLYYTSTNTEDNKVTYYFRGAVENNYVYFAGFYWRIMRINEDSSIRLIYQGETSDATGAVATIGEGIFNEEWDDNAYVGYMYGTVGSSTYEATHTNTNDSVIKTTIDTWYEENLINYSSYLADAGFCGDRSMFDGGNMYGYGDYDTIYAPLARTFGFKTPQFVCPQSNDLYTTTSSSKGNKALDYSIGLISIDEIAYAGGVYNISNTDFYLNIGVSFYSMSPMMFNLNYVNSVLIGGLNIASLASLTSLTSAYIRPVINLSQDVKVNSGTGTKDNPYVITK